MHFYMEPVKITFCGWYTYRIVSVAGMAVVPGITPEKYLGGVAGRCGPVAVKVLSSAASLLPL
jgi:hypothetical protein